LGSKLLTLRQNWNLLHLDDVSHYRVVATGNYSSLR
jgi:hypothetical protein